MNTYQDFLIKYELAKNIAVQAHQNQKYGTKPYDFHLKAVGDVLVKFGFTVTEDNFKKENALLQVSAWLHDVLEDTVLTKEHINYHFGEEIADLVWRVSDEPGANRKEKKLATYPKIKENPLAVILKLADRIANVESSIEMKKNGSLALFTMYQKEYIEFKQNIYTKKNSPEHMWETLDKMLLNK